MNQMNKILQGKCSDCGEGDIFSSPGNIFLLKMPNMHESCELCDFKFERETGFFFGARYVSYAFATAEMIAVLDLGWVLIGLTPLTVFAVISVIVILASTLNFRLSRIVWIYLFHQKK